MRHLVTGEVTRCRIAIFQFDGVILDSHNVKTKALGSMYSKYGRELEKKGSRQSSRSYSSYGTYSSYANQPTSNLAEQENESKADSEEIYTLAAREHRFSINPRINRDLLGLRPTITNQVSFSENWFGESKDASINANIRLGLGIRPKSWFGWLLKPKSNTSESEELSLFEKNTDAERFEKEIEQQDRLNQLEDIGITKESVENAESLKGDWIQKEKQKIDQKMALRNGLDQEKKTGLFQRSLESLSLNTELIIE